MKRLMRTRTIGIRATLLAGFGSVLTLLGLVSAMGIQGMAHLQAQTEVITSVYAPRLYYAERAVSDVRAAREELLSLLLADDAGRRDEELSGLQAARSRVQADFAEIARLCNSEAERALMVQVGAVWTAEAQPIQAAIVDHMMNTGDQASARALLPRLEAATDRSDALLEQIVEQDKREMEEAVRVAGNDYAQTLVASLGATALALLLGFAAAVLIGSRTARAIQKVAYAARRFASGDMAARARVDTGDEIQALAEDFNTMAASLDRQARELVARTTELANSEERLRQALEAAHMGTWDSDLRTGEVVRSDISRQLLGEPQSGSNTFEAFIQQVHPEDRASLQQAIALGIQSGSEYEVRFRVTWPDGSVHWLESRGRSVLDAAGKPARLTGTVRDITDRVEAERQRDGLARSEKLRALGQMATGMAHDLNQSLMLIATNGDLAQRALDAEPPDLEEVRELCSTASQAAFDGAETVKRLLLFASGSADEEQQPVALAALCRDVVRLTAPRWRDAAAVEGRAIDLQIDGPDEAVAMGSPARLREVLINLILNSVDALPDGGTIRLSVWSDGESAGVSVVDSGVGMSPEIQERMFEPFFTTKHEGGTGLGLAEVYGVVQRHGGSIEVQSAPGQGTSIRLAFPHAPLAVAPAEPTPQPPAVGSNRRGLRILAVDDEPAMTKAVLRMLRPAGHAVSTAASGEEALDRLEGEPFDVVVTDMGMGAGINGFELADRARKRWPHLRIVLATGWGAAIDPAEARSHGIAAVLHKPYRAADLERWLAA